MRQRLMFVPMFCLTLLLWSYSASASVVVCIINNSKFMPVQLRATNYSVRIAAKTGDKGICQDVDETLPLAVLSGVTVFQGAAFPILNEECGIYIGGGTQTLTGVDALTCPGMNTADTFLNRGIERGSYTSACVRNLRVKYTGYSQKETSSWLTLVRVTVDDC